MIFGGNFPNTHHPFLENWHLQLQLRPLQLAMESWNENIIHVIESIFPPCILPSSYTCIEWLLNWNDSTILLVGGWTTQFEKYYCNQIGSFPQVGVNKYLKPPPRLYTTNQTMADLYTFFYSKSCLEAHPCWNPAPNVRCASDPEAKRNKDQSMLNT